MAVYKCWNCPLCMSVILDVSPSSYSSEVDSSSTQTYLALIARGMRCWCSRCVQLVLQMNYLGFNVSE